MKEKKEKKQEMPNKNKDVQSKSAASTANQTPASAKPVAVVRLEMKPGSITQTHRHETECMLIVLHGACRVYLQDRTVILRENEMLQIPPQQEHVAEALSDATVLSVAAASSEWSGCGPLLHDADQYLWGV